MKRRDFLGSLPALFTLFTSPAISQTITKSFEILTETSFKKGIEELWSVSVEKDLEHVDCFAILKDGRKIWLPIIFKKQSSGEIEFDIDWVKVSKMNIEIVEMVEVHVHPPRNLSEYAKDHDIRLSEEGLKYKNEFVCDPPSLDDIAGGFERRLKDIPEKYKNKIKITGVVVVIGGIWKFTEVGKILDVKKFNEIGVKLKKQILLISVLLARHSGNLDFALNVRKDKKVSEEYKKLIELYKDIGSKVEFVPRSEVK
jgi:hypothetical protein